jgi:hypothetical protein
VSDFDEKVIERLKRLEREVERLQVKERPIVITDHGALTGLGDNDHPQYLLTTGKAADADKLDNIDSTGFVQTSGNQTVDGIKTFSSIPVLPSTNPSTANQAVRKGYADATYLGITAKAADSDKLDGVDSTGYVNTTGTQTINGAKTFGTLPTLPTTTPTANQAVRKGYADTAYLLNSGWQSYTVSWTAATTNPSIGNGTLSGRYVQIGKTVIGTIKLVIGSTTTYGSGKWRFSLPVTAKSSGLNYLGKWVIEDAGTTYYEGNLILDSAGSNVEFFIRNQNSSAEFNSTTPISWAENDQLMISIVYETA